jgi:hypothetical protein
MIESQGFDQRQRGTPDKCQQGHRDQHAGQPVEPEKSRKAGQGDDAGQADDRQALTEMVSQPAPEIGAEEAHQLHLRHQQADVPGRKIQ